MIVPIRCQSCGKPLAHLWEQFQAKIKKEKIKDVLDELKIERYCCRAKFMGTVENSDISSKFRRF